MKSLYLCLPLLLTACATTASNPTQQTGKEIFSLQATATSYGAARQDVITQATQTCKQTNTQFLPFKEEKIPDKSTGLKTYKLTYRCLTDQQVEARERGF